MVNFTQALVLFGAGWLSCLLALASGHILAKPWLDRKILPAKQGVKPVTSTEKQSAPALPASANGMTPTQQLI